MQLNKESQVTWRTHAPEHVSIGNHPSQCHSPHPPSLHITSVFLWTDLVLQPSHESHLPWLSILQDEEEEEKKEEEEERRKMKKKKEEEEEEEEEEKEKKLKKETKLQLTVIAIKLPQSGPFIQGLLKREYQIRLSEPHVSWIT